MRSNIVANPEQLAILSRVVVEYCRNNAITEQSERERVGRRVFELYAQGFKSEAELALRLFDKGTLH